MGNESNASPPPLFTGIKKDTREQGGTRGWTMMVYEFYEL